MKKKEPTPSPSRAGGETGKKREPTPSPSRAGGETGKKREPKKDHKRPWQEVYASVEDIKAFLNEHVMLRYNVITKRTEVHVIERDPDPPQEGAPPEAYVR